MNKRSLLFISFAFVAFSVCAQSKWSNLKVSGSFSSKNDISSIQFDKSGNMWISTSHGIYERTANKWTLAGLSDKYVQTLYIDADDVMWAGTWGEGLYESKDGLSWNVVSDVSSANTINAVVPDYKGNMWVGEWNSGLLSCNKGNWTSYDGKQIKLGDSTVTSIASDAKNVIWIGTYHGLTSYDEVSGTGINYNINNSKLPDNDVYSLCVDTKDNVWVGTINGLAKYNRRTWTVYRHINTPELPSNLILCLACDRKGNIWIGTEKGLCRFDGIKWFRYTAKNSPLIDNRIQTIKVHNGKIYIGTRNGVSVFE